MVKLRADRRTAEPAQQLPPFHRRQRRVQRPGLSRRLAPGASAPGEGNGKDGQKISSQHWIVGRVRASPPHAPACPPVSSSLTPAGQPYFTSSDRLNS